jgi:hypothetical protein
MADGQSHLEVVREEAEDAAAGVSPEPASRTPRWAWALGILAIVCAVGWGLTGREASRLQAALQASEADLGVARERIQDLDARMGEIRQRSRALTVQMEALTAESRSLEELAGPDPVAEAAPAARP